ncbi:MAG: SH3 domain-containing protein, partial [Sulfurovum sp.]|nr:SH3 domain-containing protein [Sulfurovum sp.]
MHQKIMLIIILMGMLSSSYAKETTIKQKNSLKNAYILKNSKRQKSKIDHMPKGRVADMKNIPQDPAFYANQIKPFSKSEQNKLDQEFNKKYFKPWSISKLDISSKDLGWEIRFIQKKPIYRANGREITASTYNKWLINADYKNIDTKKYKGITVRRTNVKALPTSDAFYRDPKKTGEGFPFDYNQNSALHINVPLHISHFSKDRRWAFVRASYAFGWIKSADLALVDKKFVETFKNNNYAMSIKDNLRLYDTKNKPISIVKLGALFPKAKDGKSYLLARRNSKGHAKIHHLKPTNPYYLVKKPLPFTPTNVAILAKEFYAEPYGWGGSYECRDCSATTRDFLGVFGIFLRRNSSKQAKDGDAINIKKLSKTAKKKKIIQE